MLYPFGFASRFVQIPLIYLFLLLLSLGRLRPSHTQDKKSTGTDLRNANMPAGQDAVHRRKSSQNKLACQHVPTWLWSSGRTYVRTE